VAGRRSCTTTKIIHASPRTSSDSRHRADQEDVVTTRIRAPLESACKPILLVRHTRYKHTAHVLRVPSTDSESPEPPTEYQRPTSKLLRRLRRAAPVTQYPISTMTMPMPMPSRKTRMSPPPTQGANIMLPCPNSQYHPHHSRLVSESRLTITTSPNILHPISFPLLPLNHGPQILRTLTNHTSIVNLSVRPGTI
jgi:hypothetical protein